MQQNTTTLYLACITDVKWCHCRQQSSIVITWHIGIYITQSSFREILRLLVLLLPQWKLLHCFSTVTVNWMVAVRSATSNLSEAHVSRDSSSPATLVISVAYNKIIIILYTVHSQNVCRNPKSQKLLKTPFLGVQGHSRSSMLTLLRSSSVVLVIISRMSVPISNCFHARRGNISKITTFR